MKFQWTKIFISSYWRKEETIWRLKIPWFINHHLVILSSFLFQRRYHQFFSPQSKQMRQVTKLFQSLNRVWSALRTKAFISQRSASDKQLKRCSHSFHRRHFSQFINFQPPQNVSKALMTLSWCFLLANTNWISCHLDFSVALLMLFCYAFT